MLRNFVAVPRLELAALAVGVVHLDDPLSGQSPFLDPPVDLLPLVPSNAGRLNHCKFEPSNVDSGSLRSQIASCILDSDNRIDEAYGASIPRAL